jgi:hypothetical protein
MYKNSTRNFHLQIPSFNMAYVWVSLSPSTVVQQMVQPRTQGLFAVQRTRASEPRKGPGYAAADGVDSLQGG